MHATDLQRRGMVTVSTDLGPVFPDDEECMRRLQAATQDPSPAHTQRLLRSVQLMSSDEKPMMVIQAAAKTSISKTSCRNQWSKEPHGKTRERYTVMTPVTYLTDAESWKTHPVLFKGVHAQALVSHFACISEDLDGCTENLYLGLDHDDALDAVGHADDGGADAEQFLDRRRAARAST